MEKTICMARGKRRDCVGCSISVPFVFSTEPPDVKAHTLKVICPDYVPTPWVEKPTLKETHLVTKVIHEKEFKAFQIEGTGLYIHQTWDNRSQQFMSPRLWSISTKQGFRVVSNTEEMHMNDFIDMCSCLFTLKGWEDHLTMLLGDGEHKKMMNQLKQVCGFI